MNDKSTEKKKAGAFAVFLRTVAVFIAIILLLLLVMWAIPFTEHAERGTVKGSADWMALLADDLPLSSIVIPGTHDSATNYVQLAFFSKCQSKDIGAQLEAGYRYLDIRLAADGEGMKLMHGFTECKTDPLPWSSALNLEEVLWQCYAFLNDHPTETVIFAVKQEHGNESIAEFQNVLDRIIKKYPEFWLLTDAVPTLAEARGKIVLMRRYADEAGLGSDAGIPLIWPDQKGHDDVSLSSEVTDQGSYLLTVQDRFEYGAEDKWAAFTNGMQNSTGEDGLHIHFLSTKGAFAYGHPYSFAKKLNPRLAEYTLNRDSGWIIVDFASAPLAAHIYKANF